jgi:hypothetical protein
VFAFLIKFYCGEIIMTQQIKKNLSQPAAKLASNIAVKAAKNPSSAGQVVGDSVENVVKISSGVVRNLQELGVNEVQKVKEKLQEKVLEVGRESADKLVKSVDGMNKVISELAELSRDNMEAAVECGNLTASFTKDISSEMFEYTNKAFSDGVELSKKAFACRTFSDMVDLQTALIKNSLDGLLGETGKITDMLFEYGSEALEPINERIANYSEQISKTFSYCVEE